MGRFRINDRYGFVDTSGRVAIKPKFNGEFSGCVARVLVKNKVNYPMKIGYIDRRGRYIWKPRV
jgi:hypothetical protein